MTSTQAAMNQALNSITNAVFQGKLATQPERLAKKELKALDIQTQAAEEEVKKTFDKLPEDMPGDIEGLTSEEARERAQANASAARDWEEYADKLQASVGKLDARANYFFRRFQNKPNEKTYQEFLDAQERTEKRQAEADEWREYSTSARDLAKDFRREQAEARALEKIYQGFNLYDNQKRGLDERERMLRELGAADRYWNERKGGNQ